MNTHTQKELNSHANNVQTQNNNNRLMQLRIVYVPIIELEHGMANHSALNAFSKIIHI